MNTSLHTLGWTDPSTLDPEGGVQLFCVGWLSVIPAVDDGVHPPGSNPRRRELIREDDELAWQVILAFLHIKDR